MLNSHRNDLNAAIWMSAARVGMMPAKVTDNIIDDVFPLTVSAANNEGAFTLFRSGLYEYVRSTLSAKTEDSENQLDMSDFDQSFIPHVQGLKRSSYYVEHLGEFVPLHRLIRDIKALDDARKYLRRKGLETLAEANALDKLYQAVVAANDNNAAAKVAA